MEVKLHHHAVPVVMIVAVLFVGSFIVIGQVSGSFSDAAKALVTRNLNVEPQKNGLAKITTVEPDPEPALPATAGSRAQFTFNLQ